MRGTVFGNGCPATFNYIAFLLFDSSAGAILYKMMSCNCTPQGPMHERLDASVHTLPGPETPIKILLRHPYVTTPPYGQF